MNRDSSVRGRTRCLVGLEANPLVAVTSPLLRILSTNLAVVGVAGAGGVLTARFLGPGGRGDVAAAVAWSGVVAGLAALGADQAAVYLASRGAVEKSNLRVSLWLAVPQALLAAAALWFVARPLVGPGQARDALVWYMLMPLSALISGAVLSWWQGLGRWRPYNVGRLLFALANLLPVLMLSIVSAPSAVSVAAANNIVMLILAIALVISARPGSTRPSFAELRPFVTYSMKAYVAVASWLIATKADQLALANRTDSRQLGYYAAGVAVAGLVGPIGSSFATLTFSRLAQPDMDALRAANILARSIKQAFVGLAAAAMLLELLVQPIIELLFGTDFLPAVSIGRVLLLAAIPLGLGYILADAHRGRGRPAIPSIAEFAGAFTAVVLMFVLIPLYGALGAALASLSAYSLTTIVLALAMIRVNRVARRVSNDVGRNS